MRAVRTFVTLAVGAASLQAQTISGRVIDRSDSLVVGGAEVRVDGARGARSDGHGEYKVGRLAGGRHEISVRMLGYAAQTDMVDVAEGQPTTHDIYLTRVPRLLSSMVVKGRSVRVPTGFEDIYRRGATGEGAFLTREQIDSINARDVVGLLHEVPFIHVNANERAPDQLTSSRCRGMLPGSRVGGQQVQLFFNGIPIDNARSLDEILRHTSPSAIQAVEVYNGPTSVPQIFKPACGVVAIWTRKG